MARKLEKSWIILHESGRTTRIQALAGPGHGYPWGASEGHGRPFEGTLVPWKSHVVLFRGPHKPS